MGTLIVLVLSFAFFALLIWLLSFYWRRVVDQNITAYFRAAQAITDNNQLPEEWITEIEGKMGRKTFNLFRRRKQSGIDLMLDKLDKTTRFFDEGSFYADEDAKAILLAELADTRRRINEMSWEELLLESNNISNLTIDS